MINLWFLAEHLATYQKRNNTQEMKKQSHQSMSYLSYKISF